MSNNQLHFCEECGRRHKAEDSLGPMPRPMNVPSLSFYGGKLSVRRHYGRLYIIQKGENKLVLTREELKLVLSARKHFIL